MEHFLENIAEFVWGEGMVLLIMGVGLLLSVRTGFIQLRPVKVLERTILSLFKKKDGVGKGGLPQLRAVLSALAAAMGTGNITGAAAAIAIGGAGAVFWMWVSAFLGMGAVFGENVLGKLYSRENSRGEAVGGPMYYIEKGLRCRPLALLYALFCVLSAVAMGNMAQSNTIASAASLTGLEVPPPAVGIIICIFTAAVTRRGIKSSSAAAAVIIPTAGILYIIGTSAVIILNRSELPAVFERIFAEAFGIRPAVGGIVGFSVRTAISVGVRRGIFSNEAGLGSSAIVHSSAEALPVTQGLWGVAEVFLDTIVCCTLTALAVLTAGAEGSDGTAMVITAFSTLLGELSAPAVGVIISVFAFATIVGWSYYGEAAAEYLLGERGRRLYRIVFPLFAAAGVLISSDAVFALCDIFNGLMALPNVTALILLSGQVRAELLRDKKDIGKSYENV